MSVKNKPDNHIRLGDYIELIVQRNSDLKYGISDVCGISNNKEIMPTRANVEGTELHNFFVVEQDELIYNSRTTRMGDKIGLGFNDTEKTLITSWNNTAFKIKPECEGELLPTYLFIYFKRSEFDRYTRYNSWGSSTEIFSWDSMCEVKIPLPDIEIQQELVDTYNGLKALAEQNEALIKPLSEACRAYIAECKKKYNEVELGDVINQRREKFNVSESLPIRGVSRDGFIPPKQEDADLSKYNVFYKYDFVFNPARMELNSIALNIELDKGICSSLYEVFSVNTSIVSPEYLNLFIKRREFARQCEYIGSGSAREYCRVANISEIKFPLPPPEVQQAIVDIYNCAEEAKKIANDAREKMKTLCPALVQRAINA